jgi:hypothetical protein
MSALELLRLLLLEYRGTASPQEVIREEFYPRITRVWDMAPLEHPYPRRLDPGAFGNLFEGLVGGVQADPDELEGIHSSEYRATLCPAQGQEITPDERHPYFVEDNYRKVLRENLAVLMRAGGWSVKRPPPAYYLDGPKRGRKVSARTIQYMMAEDGPSPTLDVVAAVAVALNLHPWCLLVPNLPRWDRPVVMDEATVEAEVSRRVTERMQALQGQLSSLMKAHGLRGSGGDVGGSSDSEAPGGGKDKSAD